MGSPRSDDWVPVERSRSSPSLGRPEDDQRPSRLDDWLAASRSLLDCSDLLERPVKACGHVPVDSLLPLLLARVLWQTEAVLDDSDLVAVPGVEAGELEVVHRSRDRSLGDLETVDVQNGENGTRDGGIEVLVGVPGSTEDRKGSVKFESVEAETIAAQSSTHAVGPVSLSPSPTTVTAIRSGLSTADGEERMSEVLFVGNVWRDLRLTDGTERNGQSVTQLSTLVDCSGRLGVDVRRETSREGECSD